MDHLHQRFLTSASGRRLLRERPVLHTSNLPMTHLQSLPLETLGGAYLHFLKTQNVSPDTRTPIRYMDTSVDSDSNSVKGGEGKEMNVHSLTERAYVMLRYRQSHDLLHVLTGLSISLTAELALKLFEFQQTGLPMTLGSALVGPLRLLVPPQSLRNQMEGGWEEYSTFWKVYAPWAVQAGARADFLFDQEWEQMWDRSLDQVRQDLKVIPFSSSLNTDLSERTTHSQLPQPQVE